MNEAKEVLINKRPEEDCGEKTNGAIMSLPELSHIINDDDQYDEELLPLEAADFTQSSSILENEEEITRESKAMDSNHITNEMLEAHENLYQSVDQTEETGDGSELIIGTFTSNVSPSPLTSEADLKQLEEDILAFESGTGERDFASGRNKQQDFNVTGHQHSDKNFYDSFDAGFLPIPDVVSFENQNHQGNAQMDADEGSAGVQELLDLAEKATGDLEEDHKDKAEKAECDNGVLVTEDASGAVEIEVESEVTKTHHEAFGKEKNTGDKTMTSTDEFDEKDCDDNEDDLNLIMPIDSADLLSLDTDVEEGAGVEMTLKDKVAIEASGETSVEGHLPVTEYAPSIDVEPDLKLFNTAHSSGVSEIEEERASEKDIPGNVSATVETEVASSAVVEVVKEESLNEVSTKTTVSDGEKISATVVKGDFKEEVGAKSSSHTRFIVTKNEEVSPQLSALATAEETSNKEVTADMTETSAINIEGEALKEDLTVNTNASKKEILEVYEVPPAPVPGATSGDKFLNVHVSANGCAPEKETACNTERVSLVPLVDEALIKKEPITENASNKEEATQIGEATSTDLLIEERAWKEGSVTGASASASTEEQIIKEKEIVECVTNMPIEKTDIKDKLRITTKLEEIKKEPSNLDIAAAKDTEIEKGETLVFAENTSQTKLVLKSHHTELDMVDLSADISNDGVNTDSELKTNLGEEEQIVEEVHERDEDDAAYVDDMTGLSIGTASGDGMDIKPDFAKKEDPSDVSPREEKSDVSTHDQLDDKQKESKPSIDGVNHHEISVQNRRENITKFTSPPQTKNQPILELSTVPKTSRSNSSITRYASPARQKSTMASDRLYAQAMERDRKKIETNSRRATLTSPPVRGHPPLLTSPPIRAGTPRKSRSASTPKARDNDRNALSAHDRLYEDARQKQILEKKREEAALKAKSERFSSPLKTTTKISPDKISRLYDQARIQELRQMKRREEAKQAERATTPSKKISVARATGLYDRGMQQKVQLEKKRAEAAAAANSSPPLPSRKQTPRKARDVTPRRTSDENQVFNRLYELSKKKNRPKEEDDKELTFMPKINKPRTSNKKLKGEKRIDHLYDEALKKSQVRKKSDLKKTVGTQPTHKEFSQCTNPETKVETPKIPKEVTKRKSLEVSSLRLDETTSPNSNNSKMRASLDTHSSENVSTKLVFERLVDKEKKLSIINPSSAINFRTPERKGTRSKASTPVSHNTPNSVIGINPRFVKDDDSIEFGSI